MKKTLTILRQGKAETGSAHQEDRTRELTLRGMQAAEIMGKYLLQRGKLPEQILCSPAKRTRETLEYLQSVLPKSLPVEFVDKLYLASAKEMLDILAGVDEKKSHVLLIGHNPGLHELCLKLAKSGDRKLLDILAIKFPTCAMATITFDTHWDELSHGTLADFTTPKMLGGEED